MWISVFSATKEHLCCIERGCQWLSPVRKAAFIDLCTEFPLEAKTQVTCYNDSFSTFVFAEKHSVISVGDRIFNEINAFPDKQNQPHLGLRLSDF